MSTPIWLDDETAAALRRRAELEQRPMKDVAGQAIREYIDRRVRTDRLGHILDEELARYGDVLKRLSQ